MSVANCAVLSILFLTSLAAAAERDRQYEKAKRDVQNVVFEGVTSFDVVELRRVLDACRALRTAADIENPLAEYVTVLRRSVAAGYAHAGFLESKVQARFDETGKRVVVRVQEGRPFRCGEIRVTGLDDAAAKDLAQALMAPFVPLTAAEVTLPRSDGGAARFWEEPSAERATIAEPVWTRNTPVAGGAIAQAGIRKRVEEHFQSCGREFAEFELHVDPRSEGDLADLLVAVQDPGLPVVVSEIVIDGLRRNSRDDVLAYLGIQKGMAFNERLPPQLQRRLLDTGRFLSAHVTIGISFRDEGQACCRLVIAIKEHPLLPLLRESLTTEEETLLKVIHWLASWTEGETPDDLVIKVTRNRAGDSLLEDFPEASLRGVISPSEGTIFTLAFRTSGGRAFAQTVVAGRECLALFSPLSRKRFDLPKEIGFPMSTTTVSIRPGEPREEEPADVQNKVGLASGLYGCAFDDKRLIRLRLAIDPSLLVLRSRQKKFKFRRKDGRVHYRSDGVELVVDERTGRLEKFTVVKALAGLDAQIHFERNAFRRELAEREQVLAGVPNDFDPRRPWPSVLVYALDGYLQFAGRGLVSAEIESLAALRKFLMIWAPLPASGALASERADHRCRFEFAVPERDADSVDERELSPSIDAAFDSIGRRKKGDPQSKKRADSHDKSEARRAPFGALLAGHPIVKASEDDKFVRLARAAQTGPIALLGGAWILSEYRPASSILIAETGLERLSLSAFQSDYRHILSNPYWGAHIASVGEALRALDSVEISALTRLLPPECGQKQVRRGLVLLANERDKPVVEVLPPILDELWEACLKDRFAEALRSFAERARGKPRS